MTYKPFQYHCRIGCDQGDPPRTQCPNCESDRSRRGNRRNPGCFAHAFSDSIVKVVRGKASAGLCQSHDFNLGTAKQARLIIDIGVAATWGGLRATAEQWYSCDVNL